MLADGRGCYLSSLLSFTLRLWVCALQMNRLLLPKECCLMHCIAPAQVPGLITKLEGFWYKVTHHGHAKPPKHPPAHAAPSARHHGPSEAFVPSEMRREASCHALQGQSEGFTLSEVGRAASCPTLQCQSEVRGVAEELSMAEGQGAEDPDDDEKVRHGKPGAIAVVTCRDEGWIACLRGLECRIMGA